MSKIPYVRQQDGPYAQQLGLQQVVIQATPPPPNYLVWSILNCLFCCWPLGIAAIIFSNKVTENAANNDQVGALEASQTARNINIAATVIGSIAIIIIIVIMVMYMSDFTNQLNDLENASLGYNY